MPVRLATNIVRFMHDNTGNWDGPAGGGVVSASFINAKPAVGGIGVEPRGGGVLRVLFTVASGAVADTVVRWRWKLRQTQVAVFDVLSDREEARHRALWPAFLAAKAAGKRAQFHRARLVVDGERLLESGNAADVHTSAVVALMNLASGCGIAAIIAAAGAIPPLVRLLTPSPSGYMQGAAAGALVNLAAEEAENAVAIADAGAIPLLVQLLRHGSSADVQVAAAGLDNLAESAVDAVIATATGANPSLGADSLDYSQRNAVFALGHLAKVAEVATTIVAAGAIPPLVRMSGPESRADVFEIAGDALRVLADSSAEICAAIAAAKASANVLLMARLGRD
ncbi:hypothetical protein FOA52_013550 [Chlamydomonas sp. UWO 241]|nr:hypothetical protein FOA52_013550 [Chlamydomonas sp. UWO 241]